MTWTAPMTFVDGRPITAAQMNTHLRDNLLEQSVAKATQAAMYFAVESGNRIGARMMQSSWVPASDETDNSQYDNLDSFGPQVTVQSSSFALVFLVCSIANSSTNQASYASWQVSGDTKKDPDDKSAIRTDGCVGASTQRLMWVDLVDDLTPGTNTFTAKYRVDGGSAASFAYRQLTVWPL